MSWHREEPGRYHFTHSAETRGDVRRDGGLWFGFVDGKQIGAFDTMTSAKSEVARRVLWPAKVKREHEMIDAYVQSYGDEVKP